MKVAALQRSEFLKARELHGASGTATARSWRRARRSSPPDVDLALEPLVEVLQRKRTVHFHTHRADDILTRAATARTNSVSSSSFSTGPSRTR